MERTREFYPMITRTIKSLLKIVALCDLQHTIELITDYPNHKSDGSILDGAIIDELDRQYARWNKGGKK